jgi:GNAT superfamily N-acetyltransferase
VIRTYYNWSYLRCDRGTFAEMIAMLPADGRMRKWFADADADAARGSAQVKAAACVYAGELAGYAAIFLWNADARVRDDWDMGVFVRPEYRRNGVATELLTNPRALRLQLPDGEKLRFYYDKHSVPFFNALTDNAVWRSMIRTNDAG